MPSKNEIAIKNKDQAPKQGEHEFMPLEITQWQWAHFPLGALRHKDGSATFAVYSSHATHILLEIYAAPIGEPAMHAFWMARGQDKIWRASLGNIPNEQAIYYGFRCWGPNWKFSEKWKTGNSSVGFIVDVDEAGNRFNPNKLLFDPYAREISHDRLNAQIMENGHDTGMYGSGGGIYQGLSEKLKPVIRREFDTGLWAPKSILIEDQSPYGNKPAIPLKDSLIYETHLRGFTRHPSTARLQEILRDIPGFEDIANVPPELQGTYAGAAFMAKYLKGLGYTAVEFLPIHEFSNDLNPESGPGADEPGGPALNGTYWGYMTYGYFAPDRHYAADKSPGGPTREFKKMVKAFHDEGIEVYLDVVYNHSAEGGIWEGDKDSAEILFLRGFDNIKYYVLAEDKKLYWDSTGCGNNLDASRRVVQNLVLDSLYYWAQEMGVDGFRFDLATTLGRGPDDNHRYSPSAELLEDISQMARELGFKIIAEAWDTQQDDSYQVGNFPLDWAEWNGNYRDTMRRFLKGDGNIAEFIRFANGDYDHFNDRKGVSKSVNIITAHDGFTLLDLVSYNQKNNGMEWPFGPTDGGNENNISWDSDGDLALRRQRLRNFFVVQLFSRGTPHTTAGDEFARTQNGNNNPYKLDTIGIWQNYDLINSNNPYSIPSEGVTAEQNKHAYHDNYGQDKNPTPKNGLFLFVQAIVGLRKIHPCLLQDQFADLQIDAGNDVTFLFKQADGCADLEDIGKSVYWHINGSNIQDTDFLLLVNMGPETVDFTVPDLHEGKEWRRIVDTSDEAEAQGNFWSLDKAEVIKAKYSVSGYAIIVLQETDQNYKG